MYSKNWERGRGRQRWSFSGSLSLLHCYYCVCLFLVNIRVVDAHSWIISMCRSSPGLLRSRESVLLPSDWMCDMRRSMAAQNGYNYWVAVKSRGSDNTDLLAILSDTSPKCWDPRNSDPQFKHLDAAKGFRKWSGYRQLVCVVCSNLDHSTIHTSQSINLSLWPFTYFPRATNYRIVCNRLFNGNNEIQWWKWRSLIEQLGGGGGVQFGKKGDIYLPSFNIYNAIPSLYIYIKIEIILFICTSRGIHWYMFSTSWKTFPHSLREHILNITCFKSLRYIETGG